MFCWKCGKKMADAAKFCCFCGTKAYVENDFEEKQPAPSKEVVIESKKENMPLPIVETDKNLVKCPDCGRMISAKAETCIGCGCPISKGATSIKIRCLSADRTVKYHVFKSGPVELARGAIGSTVTINISKPTRITVQQKYAVLSSGDTGVFVAEPGKCYEAKFCKPGLMFWETIISEVSFIS